MQNSTRTNFSTRPTKQTLLDLTLYAAMSHYMQSFRGVVFQKSRVTTWPLESLQPALFHYKTTKIFGNYWLTDIYLAPVRIIISVYLIQAVRDESLLRGNIWRCWDKLSVQHYRAEPFSYYKGAELDASVHVSVSSEAKLEDISSWFAVHGVRQLQHYTELHSHGLAVASSICS